MHVLADSPIYAILAFMECIPKTAPELTVGQFDELFPDDDACKAYLMRRRWPNGVTCPRCGSERVYTLNTHPFHWECTGCRKGGAYRFSVIVETMFEDTKIGLRQWFRVTYMTLTLRKGVSFREAQRAMGFGSYRTAVYMARRIRAALLDPKFRKLMGIVEIDETYVGGKERNKHASKRNPRNNGGAGKATVVGAVDRQGPIAGRVIAHADSNTMGGLEWTLYNGRFHE